MNKKIAIIDSKYSLKRSEFDRYNCIYSYDFCIDGARSIKNIVDDFYLTNIEFKKFHDRVLLTRRKEVENLAKIVSCVFNNDPGKNSDYKEVIASYYYIVGQKLYGAAIEKYIIASYLDQLNVAVEIYEDHIFQYTVGTAKIIESGLDSEKFIPEYKLKYFLYILRLYLKASKSIIAVIVAYILSFVINNKISNFVCFSHSIQSEYTIEYSHRSHSGRSGYENDLSFFRYNSIFGWAKMMSLGSRVGTFRNIFVSLRCLAKVVPLLQSVGNRDKETFLSIVVPSILASQIILKNFANHLMSQNSCVLYFGSDDFWSRECLRQVGDNVNIQKVFVSHGLLRNDEKDAISALYDKLVFIDDFGT